MNSQKKLLCYVMFYRKRNQRKNQNDFRLKN